MSSSDVRKAFWLNVLHQASNDWHVWQRDTGESQTSQPLSLGWYLTLEPNKETENAWCLQQAGGGRVAVSRGWNQLPSSHRHRHYRLCEQTEIGVTCNAAVWRRIGSAVYLHLWRHCGSPVYSCRQQLRPASLSPCRLGRAVLYLMATTVVWYPDFPSLHVCTSTHACFWLRNEAAAQVR